MSKEKPISNRLHLASMFMASMLSNVDTLKSAKNVANLHQLSFEETIAVAAYAYADELIKQESSTLKSNI